MMKEEISNLELPQYSKFIVRHPTISSWLIKSFKISRYELSINVYLLKDNKYDIDVLIGNSDVLDIIIQWLDGPGDVTEELTVFGAQLKDFSIEASWDYDVPRELTIIYSIKSITGIV